MLQVSIVDSGADERMATLQWLQDHLQSECKGIEYLPRVNLNPLSISELKFNANPDLLFVGSSLASGPANEIAHIREIVPEVPLVVIAPEKNFSVNTIEYLARNGVNEILAKNISSEELLRRFIMLVSRIKKKESGNLIVVDAAKGGVGATSVVAGLGELLAESGQKVLLVDCDSQRQSLSRFLQARPFLNEPLQGLIDGSRPVSEDFVEQCTVPIWSDVENMRCMSPAHEDSLSGILSSQKMRVLVAIFEILDRIFDVVIVDGSAASGSLRHILQRAADKVILVSEPDPASVYASCERIRRIREEISPESKVILLENGRRGYSGISRRMLRNEFARISGIKCGEWCSQSIRFSRGILRWPGSGFTPYSLGSRSTRHALRTLASESGLIRQCSRSGIYVRIVAPMGQWFAKCQKFLRIPKPKLIEQEKIPQITWALPEEGEKLIEHFISPPQTI